MKIYDSFLISEPHEVELLLIKLHNEYSTVEKFFALESTHTFRGDWKGRWVADTLMTDPRFKNFVHKVEVINLPNMAKGKGDFGAEFDSRDTFREKLSGFADDDVIMITDVDESVDFSDVRRRVFVLQKLRENVSNNFLTNVAVRRYWFQPNNQCKLRDLRVPMVPVKLARQNKLWSFRKDGPVIRHPDIELAFEYSYCFDKKGIWRKCQTYSHTGYVETEIETALHLNTWPRCAARGETLDCSENSDHFFEFVDLNVDNAPQYVLDNITKLQTNVVNPNYKEARRQFLEGRI